MAQEKVARLQTELDDAHALAAQQATKIKNMKKAAELPVDDPPKATGSASSKLDIPQPR